MWLITRHGFFNIVQSDDDGAKGLLTIKARHPEDLGNIKRIIKATPIETSYVNDYHYRIKAGKKDAADTVSGMIESIDYSKTKGALNRSHPDRTGLYFGVWEILSAIQCDVD